jgi:hypothetical protein
MRRCVAFADVARARRFAASSLDDRIYRVAREGAASTAGFRRHMAFSAGMPAMRDLR